MKCVGIVVALTLLVACSKNSKPVATASNVREISTSAELTSEELDILETVFRFQLERGTNGTHPERFLLSLSGGNEPWKDPPAGFLTRFRGNVPSVGPISIAGPNVGTGMHGGGTSGIILHLTDIRRLDEDTAEVYGDYYSNLRATADAYRVERIAGAWVVVKDSVRGIY